MPGQQAPSSNPPQPANIHIDDGYNVTVQVNPSQLDNTQVANDLAALKAAEGSKSSSGVEAPAKKVQRINKPQELIALELANPFRGE